MNDSGSTSRPAPSLGEKLEGASGHDPTGQNSPAGVEDQPTVITNRPPIPAAQAAGVAEGDRIGPGATLGHFRLLDYIGGGGMGRVYRAVDTQLGRIVALKVLPLEQAADPDTLLRFRNEARSAARLNHEGIAQVFFVGEHHGAPFIAFEFVEGANIRDLVNQHGPLVLGEAIRITWQVAEALAHAADRNVVHRDIKPSNVLITPEGKVKLIDLGLARMQPLTGSASDLTASGVTLGTFDYISPEQARDPRNADVRSDIYSLGCTLFFMLAGRPPFPEGTVLQKLLQHQGDEPPDIRAFRPELPEEVSRVLRRMMAKTPERRYPSPEKLIEGLVGVAEQVGLPGIAPGRTAWTAPPAQSPSLWQRHLPWMVPFAALVAIVVLLHYAWSPAPSQPPAPDGLSGPLQPGRVRAWPEERVGGLPLPSPSESDQGGSSQGGPERPAASEPGQEGEEQIAAEPRPAGAGEPGGNAAASPARPEVPLSGPDEGPTPPAGATSDTSPESPPQVPGSENPQAGGPPAETASPAPAGPGRPAAEADTPTPPPPGPSATATTPVHAVLVVDPTGQTEGAFPSLAAACAKAAAGDVVELHYSGRLAQQQHAANFANLDLTIRPGKGCEPILTYRPQVHPIKYPHHMFAISGSRLTLENLALEMEIPPEILADDWSMFQLGPGETLALKQCSLTIRNSSIQPDVAFLRLQAPLGSEMIRRETTGGSAYPASVELSDCVVRGQATLLRVDDLLAVDLTWENGLLATTEQLLQARGGDKMPPPGEEIRITLQHVTAVVHGGLCRWSVQSSAPHQPPTQITSAACVFLGNDLAPLGQQETAGSVDDALSQVVWHGRYNAYNGFANFWTIRSIDPSHPAVVWTMEEWLERVGMETEVEPLTGPLAWRRLPRPDRPVDEHTPSDYAILDGPFANSTEDGHPAGFLWQLLPPVPESPKNGPSDQGG